MKDVEQDNWAGWHQAEVSEGEMGREGGREGCSTCVSQLSHSGLDRFLSQNCQWS